MGLEIIRTAGGKRGKRIKKKKKTIIKGNEKAAEDARVFDSEG